MTDERLTHHTRSGLLATCMGLIFCIGIVHIAWSQALIVAIHEFYGHRFANFNSFSTSERSWVETTNSFYHDFSGRHHAQEKKLMFMGSSFTYGYPWQENIIFSRLIENDIKSYDVANLSAIAMSMQGIVDFALCPKNKEDIPDILVAEVPLVNSVVSADKSPKPDWIEVCHPQAKSHNYTRMILSRPMGLGWVRLLWDNEAYEKPEAELLVPQLPKGYFLSRKEFEVVESKYINQLNIYFDYVAGLGKKVFVFVSPIHTPVIDSAGGESAAVEYQINLTYEVCKRHGKVICLDASSFNTRRELFYNLTHLNQRGHRAMAQWFEEIIVRQGPTPAPPALPSPSK